MKILTIQAAYFPMIGGAEVFHQKTAEWMVEQGHQVDVAACLWDKPDINWRGWQKEREMINGVKIYRAKPWFYLQYLKSFGAIWPLYQRCLKLIEKNDYDLIHAHIFPALIVGALLKRKTGLPLVTTIQGGDVADYSETGSKLGWLLKPIISWSLKKANTVHTVSTHMEKAVKRLGITKTIVIPNGVDTALFKPRNKANFRRKYHLPKRKFIIVSHSRLTPKNGLDLLLKAVARITQRKKILLLIIGGGEQEGKLKVLVKKLRLERIVTFLGYRSRAETAELLPLGDLFVRPSRQEGFGIAFIEAMVSGLPVVGTKTGGIVEIVKEGETGLLVRVNDVSGLTAAINKIINDKTLAKSLSLKALKFVRQHFSWSKINAEIENLYARVLANK